MKPADSYLDGHAQNDGEELDNLIQELSLDPAYEQVVSEIGGGRVSSIILPISSPKPTSSLMNMQLCDLSMVKTVTTRLKYGNQTNTTETEVSRRMRSLCDTRFN